MIQRNNSNKMNWRRKSSNNNNNNNNNNGKLLINNYNNYNNFILNINYDWTLNIILIILIHNICPSHEQFFTGTLGSSGISSISSSSSGSGSNSGGGSGMSGQSSGHSNSNSNSNSNSGSASTSDEWDNNGFRSGSYGNGYNCVNIPNNFTLCKNIGYTKMMIPNLLGHDSLQEAEYHAKSWVPLLGLQCHPDTQLFLCSLFSPICLDRAIYPCRSLCQGVQARCEPRMLAYKYPWPSMLKCDQFPEDHDLCIRPGAANNEEKNEEPDCPSCHQAHTCENIVDNFCRADFVFRAKFKRSRGSTMEFRKGRWFKPKEGSRRLRPDIRSFELEPKDNCCSNQLRPGIPYIIMGISKGDTRTITFVMPWNGKDKVLKNAVRTFRSMDCSNPLPMSVMATGGEESNIGSGKNNNNNNNNNSTTSNNGRRQRRKQGKRRGRQYGGCRVTTLGKNP